MSNRWNSFLKAYSGNGYSMKELSYLYRSNQIGGDSEVKTEDDSVEWITYHVSDPDEDNKVTVTITEHNPENITEHTGDLVSKYTIGDDYYISIRVVGIDINVIMRDIPITEGFYNNLP